MVAVEHGQNKAINFGMEREDLIRTLIRGCAGKEDPEVYRSDLIGLCENGAGIAKSRMATFVA
jgi:hypothetical protein